MRFHRRPPSLLSADAVAWSEAQADARARSASFDPLSLLAGAAAAADATVVFALSLLVFSLRSGGDGPPLFITTTAILASLLMVNALSLSGAYTTHLRDGFIAEVGRAVQAWSVVFVLLIAGGYLTKTSSDFSRLWAVSWYGCVVLGLAAVRLAVSVQLRRWRSRGRLAHILAVVDLTRSAPGDGPLGGPNLHGPDLTRRLLAGRAPETRLLGVFSDAPPTPDRVGAGGAALTSDRVGAGGAALTSDGGDPSGAALTPDDDASGIADLLALSLLFRIDEIVVVVSADTGADLPAILRRLGAIPTDVRLCPLLPPLLLPPLAATPLRHGTLRQAAVVGDLPMLTVHRQPLDAWSGLVKRVEDLVFGTVLLVALSPLMALVAIAIRLDGPGPVLFRQARQGFNHNTFTVLKFRTMRPAPPGGEPGAGVPQATRDDKRVTRVGRLLRRTSLDELPQLFNVLRGEMSLVGPRPHATVHNEHYAAVIDDYLARHRVPPGITGWAQINGLRGETDTLDKMQKRVEFDLAYIDNWSVGLDLKIIMLTAIKVIFDRTAY